VSQPKLRLLQCLVCGYIFSPRVANPKSCPRCKNYFKGRVKEIEDPREFQRTNPLWEQKGDLVIVEDPKPCQVCGRLFRKFIEIQGRKYCRYCIFSLLSEDALDLDLP